MANSGGNRGIAEKPHIRKEREIGRRPREEETVKHRAGQEMEQTTGDLTLNNRLPRRM